jgi:selenocysteine-specific elongation factor
LPVASLVTRGGLSIGDAERLVRAGADAQRWSRVGDLLFSTGVVNALRDAIHRELTRFHASHPDEAGMPREQLRDRTAGRTAPALFDHLLAEMTAAQIVRGTERVGLVTYAPAPSDADTAARTRARAVIQAAGLGGADAAALAPVIGDPARVERTALVLVRDGDVIKVSNLYFDAAALRRLKAEVQALKTPSAGQPVQLDVGTFKSKFGLTRRAAIPLLEWLDRERVTRRTGQTRVIL